MRGGFADTLGMVVVVIGKICHRGQVIRAVGYGGGRRVIASTRHGQRHGVTGPRPPGQQDDEEDDEVITIHDSSDESDSESDSASVVTSVDGCSIGSMDQDVMKENRDSISESHLENLSLPTVTTA